jgi:hypothetical protein
MTQFIHKPDEVAADILPWEERSDTEETRELPEVDGDCMPVLADQFRITDMQHWIDLCA